jgi:hypothetical protein
VLQRTPGTSYVSTNHRGPAPLNTALDRMSALRFTGVVGFRSSGSNPSGPPGERAVLALNPQRAEGIVNATGWARLEPGSLNLSVSNEVIDQLKLLKPVWEEAGSSVAYPAPYEHIPRLREAYLYYLGEAQVAGKRQQVLIRTARNALPGRVELFAPISLRTHFGLNERDRVTVEAHAI